ncbi:RES family NAD+ phosphorylase [Actibacterium sp. XHP0104]|uniref:RES family NAD+ phosphorylase n=1 Tax=Actibacterium sp. XHP0104 TaxID=2984335 RepID=UPI0021E6F708|nr:RES family NAD+ phosphorylase [Actibacterium sp. XHP0104]MCV2882158.1 RES family NAD+ phosphorylase [Actibacterium sp. XHP0104]
MKPLQDRAMEGRANPKGVPMLYLCSNKNAAMSEVRPWIGSMISLGRFVTTRELRLVDCSRFSAVRADVLFEKPSIDKWPELVWSDIDRAFTKPVTRSDDTGEYVATQILVELFRDEGFDGISYQSAFGERSTNVALFDLDAAELISCQLFEATSINMNFQDRENPYWVRKSKRRKR